MKLVGLTLVAALSERLLADAQTPPNTDNVTNNFLLGFNLARTAKIDTQGALLQADDNLQQQASAELKGFFTDNTQCNSKAQSLNDTPFAGFYVVLPQGYQDSEAWGTNDVENELVAALKELGSHTTEGVGTVFDPKKVPFTDQSVRNAAYMMFQTSTNVGCAKTNDCSSDGTSQYLLCLFTPTLVNSQSVPFPTALYDAMVAREKAGVTLVKLTKDALQTPLTVPTPPCGGGAGAAGGEGAASYALPGVGLLLFTVTGMLAF